MNVLAAYQRISRWPAGRWLFSRLVCWKAPYFASIAPRIESLEPGRGIATLAHRRRVTNHLGTVHAIAAVEHPIRQRGRAHRLAGDDVLGDPFRNVRKILQCERREDDIHAARLP